MNEETHDWLIKKFVNGEKESDLKVKCRIFAIVKLERFDYLLKSGLSYLANIS